MAGLSARSAMRCAGCGKGRNERGQRQLLTSLLPEATWESREAEWRAREGAGTMNCLTPGELSLSGQCRPPFSS